MKRHIIYICVAAMAAVAQTVRADQPDWMRTVGDGVFVRQLSVPGAHDAAANANVSLATYSQTQSKSIADMLVAGVRAFDLRPKANKADMPLFHGTSTTNYTLRSALTEIGDFLGTHADEMAIVLVRDESDGGGAGNFFPYLKTILTEGGKSYSGRFVRFRKDLTLGECRGKILVLSRERPESDDVCPVDYISGWDGCNTYSFAQMRGPRVNGDVWCYVQDYWEVSDHALKQEGIVRMLDFSQSGLTRRDGHHTWVFNCTSGYIKSGILGVSTATAYAENAAYQNSRVVERLADRHGPVGIMLMDYAADDNGKSKATNGLALTNALIANNAYIDIEGEGDGEVKSGTTPFEATPARANTLRAPSVPLIATDPYMQLWSNGDNLYGQNTTHRDGASKRMYAFLRVDGKSYRLMGAGDLPMIWLGNDAECRYRSAATMADGWADRSYDDASWTDGSGPFNGGDTNNGWTDWASAGAQDLYVRYHLSLTDRELSLINRLHLYIAYDQDPVLYINGVEAWRADGWRNNGNDFADVELDDAATNLLVGGDNVLALKVGRGGGGQYLNCRLGATLLDGQPLTATQQGRAQVMASQTYYQMKAGPVDVALTFTNPQRLDDLDLLATPVSYVSYQVTPNDGGHHNVQMYLLVSPEWVARDNGFGRFTTQMEVQGLKMVRTGHDVQDIHGSNRADWGYLYVVADPSQDQDVAFGYDATRFLADGTIPARPLDGNRHELFSSDNNHPLIVFRDNLGRVESGTKQQGFTVMGYDYDGKVIADADGGTGNRPGYYGRQGAFENILRTYVDSYADKMSAARQWDERVYDDAEETGGTKLAELASLAYRQTAAAHIVAQDTAGDALVYNISAGFWQKTQSVDALFTAAPLLLTYNPELVENCLQPTINYYKIPQWTSQWAGDNCAPHTLGAFPWIGSSESNGRLETNANMLLVAAVTAICMEEPTSFVGDNYVTFKEWADNTLLYLNGTRQISGEWSLDDDGFGGIGGRLTNSQHLRAKAILAVAAMGVLAELNGNASDANAYRQTAATMAAQWKADNLLGDHYRQASTAEWGQKYALVYDLLLDTNLFDDVISAEMAYYKTKLATYGLPIDGRSNIGALGETLATAAMTDDDSDWDAFLAPTYQYVGKTAQRVPLRTSYYVTNASSWGDNGIDDGNSQKGSPFVGLLWTRQLVEKVRAIRDVTAVTAVDSPAQYTTGKWYNLQGQQVTSGMQKGVYIHDKKKVIVR